MEQILRAKTHRKSAVLVTSAIIRDQLSKEVEQEFPVLSWRGPNRLLRVMKVSHPHGLIDRALVSGRPCHGRSSLPQQP